MKGINPNPFWTQKSAIKNKKVSKMWGSVRPGLVHPIEWARSSVGGILLRACRKKLISVCNLERELANPYASKTAKPALFRGNGAVIVYLFRRFFYPREGVKNVMLRTSWPELRQRYGRCYGGGSCRSVSEGVLAWESLPLHLATLTKKAQKKVAT